MQQIWGTSGDPLILAPYGFLDYFPTKRYDTDFSEHESQEADLQSSENRLRTSLGCKQIIVLRNARNVHVSLIVTSFPVYIILYLALPSFCGRIRHITPILGITLGLAATPCQDSLVPRPSTPRLLAVRILQVIKNWRCGRPGNEANARILQLLSCCCRPACMSANLLSTFVH